MKKAIAIILMITLLISFMPNLCFGESEEQKKKSDAYKDTISEKDAQMQVYLNEYDALSEKGEVNYGGHTAYPRGTPSTGSAIATLGSAILTVFPKVASMLMTSLIHSKTVEGGYELTPDGPFTIENLVFGMIEIFDANYFSYNSNLINTSLKQNVQVWYATVRIIAIAASLITLIYMGIRMAISTTASDKAKYKSMLMDWIFSFILIFILHYIVVIASNLSTSLTFLFTANADQITLEEQIISDRTNRMAITNGWNMTLEAILYTMLVFYQIRFFLMYLKRLLVIGFLLVIAPLITITYAIDRAGDNKSQIFSFWIKEMLVNIFIRPFHAFFYMVFIYSAGAIAVASPVIAVFFFMALSRGEKIVKGLFGLRGLQTINSMSEYFKLKR